MRTNQDRFRALLARGQLTQAQAAQCIADHTHRPCSPRAVRAWLSPADRPSARSCPDWAVEALEQRLTTLGKLQA